MPAKRLSMRKTREILRLRLGLGLSLRDTARSVRVSSSTVSECVSRAARAGLGWPLPPELDDAALESRLYPSEVAQRNRPMPDFRRVHTELRRKGVTLELLWHEYRATHPDGYGCQGPSDVIACGSADLIRGAGSIAYARNVGMFGSADLILTRPWLWAAGACWAGSGRTRPRCR